MHESAEPNKQSPLRRIALLGVLFVAAVVSCGKDVTGPLGSAVRYARGLAFDPIFPPAFQAAGGSGSGVVDFTSVHVVLHHSDGSVALDTTINFPAGQDSLTVDLTVKLLDNAPSTGEPMSLDLGYLNAAGVVVFEGGPVSITAAPPAASGTPNPPVQVPVTYTGPGASAVSVSISPRTQTVVAGSPFSFGAVAKDATGATIASTPIIWNSLDPSVATITSPAAGSGVAQNLRGTARIIAQLFSGASDTVLVSVTLPASQLISQSGNAQSGVVGASLAQPLVVKVAASDGVGVAGTQVTFAVASGGGSVTNATATSDVNGLAQTTFKLGPGTGTQTVTASAGSLNNSPLTFSATAQPATATKLVVTTGPVNGVAGTALAPIVFTAQDNNGNTATTFTGPVAIAFGTNSTSATLGGTTTVNAVAGVATFSGLSVNKNGTAYTLVASNSGLVSATTGTFDVAVGAPNKLVFTVQPTGAIANAPMSPAIVVNAQDSQGNATPSFTGAVTLAFATNPSSATLGGTLTVNAVAGAATFSGISVSAPGTGYSLSASATGLTAATSSLFNTGGGVATSISVASGGAQTGLISTALALPVVIQVNDAGSNPVAGTTVTFAVVTGGGSVSPLSGVSNAAGQVQTTWTLGATVGAQSISATSAGLAGSPLTINATGTAAAVATQLKFTVQPGNTTAGANVSPSTVVQARDAGNALVPAFVGNVTLTIAANPGASTLGGTVTVAAVGGIATFNNITLNHSGIGYTLNAASGVLTPDVSTTFNITPGAAANIAIIGGQAQSGAVSTMLPSPLQVLVTDANANAVSAGTNVNWAIVTGAGSVAPASSATNAAGVAQTTWTLGPGAGGQSVSATSIGLTGSPLTFTANATSATASKTWTGATNNSWAVGTNWAPAGVPSATDSVFIPAVGTLPTLSASATVGGLTIASSASLTLAGGAVTLTDNGVLDATGAIVGGGNVALTPVPAVARLLKGVVGGAVTINGTYGMNGPLTVTGNVVINSGTVGFNNNPLIINGNFSTTGTGVITMPNASDLLSVFGSATFAGGAETGLLTNGTINLTGTFVQNVTAASFAASGANTVVFSGTVAQSVIFSNTVASHFQNVQVTNAAGVPLATNGVMMNGNVGIAVGGISGAVTLNIGGTLTDPTGLLQVGTIVFSGNTPVSVSTGTINTPTVKFTGGATIITANLTVNGDAIVDLTGKFSPNGHTLTTTGNFVTQASGTLQMTGASDAVVVQGNASFGGGSTAGLLTNGTLTVFGDFTQTGGTSTSSFQAVAPHLTLLNSNFGTENISFANPDTVLTGACALSCFGNFTVSKTAGTLAINSMVGVGGSVNINAGVTTVTATHFVLVHGSTTIASGTNVNVSRFGTFGAITFAPDSSTIADTIQFHGTAAQTIPLAEYNEVVIKGSPTLSAGGFIADGNLTVDGGTLTLGGNAVSVFGGFLTTNNGLLVMTNPVDSLLIVGQATFSGGAESGNLTNGALVLFQGIAVSGAGQFSASGNHTTVLVGPASGGCDCTDILAGHHGTVALATRAPAKTKALFQALIAARHAKSQAIANGARAKLAALKAARTALASKWMPSATGIRMAAAAGKNAKLPHAIQPRALAAVKSRALADVRINGPRISAPRAPISAGNFHRSSSIVVQSYSDSAVYVTFTTPSGNQFGNVRVIGATQWVTLAAAAGNVEIDTTGDIAGNGQLTVGGNLTGSLKSSIELETVELFGVLADSGTFEPNTTIFSGASQVMPSQVGDSAKIAYTNVVVNSPSLGVPAEDDVEIDVSGSLIVQNSGVLRIGLPIGACPSCDSDELYVWGSFETHGSGALQMNDTNFPYMAVSDSALFAGGSTASLLTQGDIDYYGNFRQSGPVTTSYAADSLHESYFGATSANIIFANPGTAASHFGELYLGGTTAVFASNIYANGELETGHVAAHTASAGTPGVGITSLGADVRDLEFYGVTWTLLDGNAVTDMDAVEFANESPTATQFTMSRNGAGSLASLTNWIFDVVPTSGKYMSVNDTDGATNGVLTVNMSGTSPGSPGAFTSTSGGAIINGWTNFTSASWLGNNGTWNLGTNWSSGVAPDASTDVTINCDCAAPTTSSAVTVHNLTMAGSGVQLTLGAALTVNGALSIAANSNIAVGTNNVTLLGNVFTDTTAAFGGVTCNAGNRSTGAILAGSGTQSVYGKFCALTVASNVMAAGKILVKHTTSGDAAIIIQSGGNLDMNSHRVDTDSMVTTGGGTFMMTHALDSLIIHGASGNFAVNFNGGSETGLITNGTIVMRSPNFHANGTSFDATFNNVVVADTTGGQTFRWTGATVGHGFNNLILKNSNFDNFGTTDLVVQGTLTLDVSMGTSGQFAATGASLYADGLVDNTGNPTGGFAGAYWIHFTHVTGAVLVPALLPVDSVFFEGGGNMQLANNVSTGGVVVVRPDVLSSSNTGLLLNGHRLKTTNKDFITTGTAFLYMQNASDSLDVGTASVFFNGGDGFGSWLTNGGIAAGGFYQGYTSTTALASGAAASSYNPSGAHRIWLTGNAKVIFANPGTGATASHFNSMHNAGGFTTTLYSDVFVDDSLYLGSSGIAIASDGPTDAAKTRLLTTKGLGNNTSAQNASFSNVSVKWVDGQAAPTNWDNISWTNFPLLFSGTVFEVNRSTSSAPTLAFHNFLSVITSALDGLTGKFVNNTSPAGGPTLSFTSVSGFLNFSLSPGTSKP